MGADEHLECLKEKDWGALWEVIKAHTAHVAEGDNPGGFRDRLLRTEIDLKALKERFWQSSAEGEVIGTTTSNTTSEQTILAGRAEAYDLYYVFFTLDADDVNNHINSGDMLQVCIKRIAASANEVANEVIVWDWVTMWCVDKVYGDWSVEANDA